jgi:hypothetical protein
VDGQRQGITKQQAVRPWWKTDPSGQVEMSIKFGAKPIEFEKGKAGIVVPSKDKLPKVIATLMAAVRPVSWTSCSAKLPRRAPSVRRARPLDHQSSRDREGFPARVTTDGRSPRTCKHAGIEVPSTDDVPASGAENIL